MSIEKSDLNPKFQIRVLGSLKNLGYKLINILLVLVKALQRLT